MRSTRLAVDSSFFGLDLQVGDPRLNGTVITGGGALTPEILDEVFQRSLNAPPPIPCGCKGNPHLVRPWPIGEITYCIQCGYLCVQEGAGYRDLNEQEKKLMGDAFKSLMDKSTRRKRKR